VGFRAKRCWSLLRKKCLGKRPHRLFPAHKARIGPERDFLRYGLARSRIGSPPTTIRISRHEDDGRTGDVLAHRTAPGAISVLPGQAIKHIVRSIAPGQERALPLLKTPPDAFIIVMRRYKLTKPHTVR
jgi:hypothetical protein